MLRRECLKYEIPTVSNAACDTDKMHLSDMSRIDASARPFSEEAGRIMRVLADTKSGMDQFSTDPLLTRALMDVDDYKCLKSHVAKTYGAQACTNAWLKFYEILGQFGVLERAQKLSPGGVKMFFNAELPGAFISATNHYAYTHNIPFDWFAASLWPSKGSGALDDIYHMYKNYRHRWLMGPVINGDLTSPIEIRRLAADALLMTVGADGLPTAYDVYTSDAGLSVDESTTTQEMADAPLHLGQCIVGLMVLKRGGSMIVKQYTFMTHFTSSLIGILANHFGRLRIVKPISSRSANSETYLVCENYDKNVGDDTLDAMHSLLASGQCAGETPQQHKIGEGRLAPNPTLEFYDVLRPAHEALENAARGIFEEVQCDYIREALRIHQELRTHGGKNSVRRRRRTPVRDAIHAYTEKNRIYELPCNAHLMLK